MKKSETGKTNLKLRSEEVQEILTTPPAWIIRSGNFLILMAIVVLLIFSSIIQYPDLIKSKAILKTEIPINKKSSKITGEIFEILVPNKATVKKNQILIVLESSANYKDVLDLKKLLNGIVLDKDEMYFELDNVPIYKLGELENAYSEFESNYLNFSLNRDYQPLELESELQSANLYELQTQLENYKLQLALQKKEVENINKDLDRHEILYRKGVISQNEIEKKRILSYQSEANYENLLAKVSKTKSEIHLVRKNTFSNNLNMIFESRKLFGNTKHSLSKLKKEIENWENKYIIKSDLDGKVSFLKNLYPNQVVYENDELLVVTPDDHNNIFAELYAPVENSGKVEISQKVNISLQNFPEMEYGTLDARIIDISAVPSDEGNYLIKATLPNNMTTSYGIELDYKPEMSGIGSIITEKTSLLEKLLYQIKSVIFN